MPEKLARTILNTHWNGKLPIEPAEIARRMGFAVTEMESRACATVSCRPSLLTIAVDAQQPVIRQRFAVAHALGHYVLSHGKKDCGIECFSSLVLDDQEVAANEFALALLVPAWELNFLIEKKNITRIDALARCFHVSLAAMGCRVGFA